MKTFKQFYIESTALDRHIGKLKKEFESGNVMQKIRIADKMKNLESKTGVSSLVKSAD